MKANELRIGNLIFLNSMIIEVNTIKTLTSRIDINRSPESYFEPIPLTEEILLKCGFKNDNDEAYFYIEIKSPRMTISINPNFKGIAFFDSDDSQTNRFEIEINYLHKLQNLYFALGGEELEIEL